MPDWSFEDAIGGATDAIGGATDAIGGFTDQVGGIITAEAQNALRPLANFLKDTWNNILRWLFNTMANILTSIPSQEFQNVNDDSITCLDLISNAHNGVISVIGETISSFFNSIGAKLRQEAAGIGSEQIEKYTNDDESWNL